MNVPHGPLPSSLRTFLFGADSIAALADSFVEVTALDDIQTRVAKHLGDGALEGFRHRLATAAAEFIDLDPARVVGDGFRRHAGLVAVAERTRDSGGPALVPLGRRRMSLKQHPAVDVELEGESLGTVEFELSLTIDIADLAAVVRGGVLVELEGERCELHAAFVLAPGEMLAHQAVAFDANMAVPLDKGIRLVPSDG